MIVLALFAASSLQATPLGTVVPPNCGKTLIDVPWTPRALKLKPKVLAAALAEPGTAALLKAFDRLFDLTAGTKNLARIGQQLLEPNELSHGEREALRENAYFKAHPGAVTDLAIDNLAVLRPLLELQVDEFTTGLLATLLPESPKAFNGLHVIERPRTADLLNPYLARAEYRDAVASFLHAAAITNMYPNLKRSTTALRVSQAIRANHFSVLDVELAFGDLHQFGKVLSSESHQAGLLQLEVQHGITAATRRSLRQALNLTIRRHLPGFSDVLELQTLLLGFGYLDPLPLANEDLRRVMIARYQDWILPLKAAVNATHAPPRAEPTAFDVGALFEPEPTGHKRQDEDLPPEPSEEGWSLFRARVKEGDALSSYWQHDSSRFGQDLVPGKRYSFWVARDRSVQIQTVEFAGPAVDWIKAHARDGRAVLKALHFGTARGDRPGMMPVFARSEKFKGGRFHRLRTAGQFSGVAIKIKDTWQVLSISPNAEVETKVKISEPIYR